MVYFSDYVYFRHEGRTLTGLQYIWDKYGPNAVDNQIVVEADRLAQLGLIHMRRQLNEYGDYSYLYHADPGTLSPVLDPLAEIVVHDVVNRYRDYSATAIADASKKTAPFTNAHPGDVLAFGTAYALSTEAIDLATVKRLSEEEGESLNELQAECGPA
jgi:hypothetical protein